MTTTKLSMQEVRRLIGGQMLLDGSGVPEVVEALHVAPCRNNLFVQNDAPPNFYLKGNTGIYGTTITSVKGKNEFNFDLKSDPGIEFKTPPGYLVSLGKKRQS